MCFKEFLCKLSSDLQNHEHYISDLKYDINTINLWQTGGIGSKGEEYNVRNTSIRTEYIQIDDIYEFEVKNNNISGYYVLYNSSKQFIVRNQINAPIHILIESLKSLYINAQYIRFEIFNVDGDTSEFYLINLLPSQSVIAKIKRDLLNTRSELDIIKSLTKLPINITLGRNIYMENGVMVSNDNTKRACIIESTKNMKYIYICDIMNDYTYTVYLKINDAWNKTTIDNTNENNIIDVAEASMYALQIFCNRTIQDTDIPLNIFGDINNTIDKIYNYIEEPLDIQIGFNRYLDNNGNILTNTNTKRASTPPIRISYSNFTIIVNNIKNTFDYVGMFVSHDGINWELHQKIYDDTTFSLNFGDYVFFQVISSVDIPTNIKFKLFKMYYNIIDGIRNIPISTINIGDNKFNLPVSNIDWVIGGVGSNGEDYYRGDHTIRTNNFIGGCYKVIADEDYTFSASKYDLDYAFLHRDTNITSLICDPNKYYRFELFYKPNDTTDTTQIANITERASHLQIICCTDTSLSILGAAADAKTVSNIINNINPISTNVEDLISQAKYVYSATDSGVGTEKTLTLLHISDIHDNYNGMKYAIDIYHKYQNKIDDMLHTGDTVRANLSDGIANWINSGCAVQVLNVIGNHDTEESLVLQAAGKDNVYNTLFSPYISNWNVIQPIGVDDSTSDDYHALYYYKDYVDAKIRLIVLDTNFWDDAEKTYLTNTLNDAITNDLAVLIACHDVKKLTEMTQSNFSNYKGDGINETKNSYANQPDNWLDPVTDFVNNGGEFIGILAGHNHSGHMGYMTNYPNFFVYVTQKSSMDRVSGTARILNQKNQNTVSIITINRTEKLFKIVVVGANVDGLMRPRNVFCYNYQTKTIISQW